MRNIKTGTTTVETVHSDDKLEKAHIEKKKMFYSYDMGDTYVFMEENGNTIEIPADTIEE
jgi:translation elongation factor P/translation initiation factor 5A